MRSDAEVISEEAFEENEDYSDQFGKLKEAKFPRRTSWDDPDEAQEEDDGNQLDLENLDEVASGLLHDIFVDDPFDKAMQLK